MSAPHPQVIHEEPDELISALDSQLTLGTGDVSGQCQWGYNTGEYDQGDDGGSSARSSPVLWAGDGSDEDEPRYGCDLCIGGCCRDIGEPGCGVCHCCKALTNQGFDCYNYTSPPGASGGQLSAASAQLGSGGAQLGALTPDTIGALQQGGLNQSPRSSARSSPVLFEGLGDDDEDLHLGCDLCGGGCCRDAGTPGCGVCHCCKAHPYLGGQNDDDAADKESTRSSPVLFSDADLSE